MLHVTPDGTALQLRLVDWHPNQPKVEGGVGHRSEVLCRASWENGTLVIRYLQSEYFERETPIVPWKLSATVIEDHHAYSEHLLRAAAWAELFAATPMEVRWPNVR